VEKFKLLPAKGLLFVYLLLSVPAVGFVGYKVIRKCTNYLNDLRDNKDFELAAEEELKIDNAGKIFTDYTLIAHAGGAIFIDNKREVYTNSREAVTGNYERGHRVFEIDFQLTQDGKLAAVHDWVYGAAVTGGTWGEEGTSIQEWKSRKILGKCTTMDIEDVVNLMNIYPDMYLVTDTKATDREMVITEFSEIYNAVKKINVDILDRVVPQIYYPQMLKEIYSVYPFQNVIYTLYQSSQSAEDVVEFVRNHRSIKAVTMRPSVATENFVKELSDIDVPVYVHTINRFDEALELSKRGIRGFYTDDLL
jgi:glycerophosphoryl diester phosphodiesterase